MNMVTTNRDKVRAAFTPEEAALYAARSRAWNYEFEAESALKQARRALTKARREVTAAKAAFDATPGGAAYDEAVTLDIAAEEAAKRAPAAA